MSLDYLFKYRDELKRCISDLRNKDRFYRQIPNLLTVSRAIGMIPVNILFFTGNVIPGIMLVLILLGTDFVDGKIARKYNIVSNLGADLDAVCDKVMVLGLTLPLMFGNPILFLNLILEGCITSVNVIGRIKGMNTKTLYVGKVKTCFLSNMLLLGYLVEFFSVSSIYLIISSIIAMISQGVTFKGYLCEYNKMKEEKTLINVIDNECISNNLEIENVIIKEKMYLNDKNLDAECKRRVRKRNIHN